ncbi:MAG: hypothetical protein U1A78_02515 [Polyangia bacterium]
MSVRFDEALAGWLQEVEAALAGERAATGQVIIVRDLRGRMRLVLERSPERPEALAALQARLDEAAGPFAGGPPLVAADLLAPEAVLRSPDLHVVPGCSRVQLLERTVTGADWTRPPLPDAAPSIPRATLYGIKGGVGRSLALCAWAHYLARQGKKVLCVDLDLESPGISSTLLPAEASADFGVVDWLVEDAVGNADDTLVRLMAAQSPLAAGTPGSILVVPCGGSTEIARSADGYMAKLARAYIDLPRSAGSVESFADRLARMLDALEAEHRPEVVLLDSRAGLHDIAAVAITRLAAMSFLFAIGNRQTWDGYRKLLSQWQHQPQIGGEVRRRLRVVAAQVPETGREAYLRQFELDAYSLFAETLYEEAAAENLGAFNFDKNDPDAPHFRLPIYWSRALQEWNPLSDAVTLEQHEAAFGSFLPVATEQLLAGEPAGLAPFADQEGLP